MTVWWCFRMRASPNQALQRRPRSTFHRVTGKAARGPAERSSLGAVLAATAERGGARQRFSPVSTPCSFDRNVPPAALTRGGQCSASDCPLTASPRRRLVGKHLAAERNGCSASGGLGGAAISALPASGAVTGGAPGRRGRDD